MARVALALEGRIREAKRSNEKMETADPSGRAVRVVTYVPQWGIICWKELFVLAATG